jgi:hypothetical protein
MDEEITKEDYENMKKKAIEFAKILIEGEKEFKFDVNDCDEGVGAYFNIKTTEDNKIITIYFKDNGYMGIMVKEDD